MTFDHFARGKGQSGVHKKYALFLNAAKPQTEF